METVGVKYQPLILISKPFFVKFNFGQHSSNKFDEHLIKTAWRSWFIYCLVSTGETIQ